MAHPSASKSSCTSLCSLLHHQTHLLEGGKGAVRVFLVSPLGQPRQGCLHARRTSDRRHQAGGQHGSGHFWVTCSVASSGTPCRRDLLLGAVLHEAKTFIHHGVFSHSGWASQSCKYKLSIATACAPSAETSLKVSTPEIDQEQDSKVFQSMVFSCEQKTSSFVYSKPPLACCFLRCPCIQLFQHLEAGPYLWTPGRRPTSQLPSALNTSTFPPLLSDCTKHPWCILSNNLCQYS